MQKKVPSCFYGTGEGLVFLALRPATDGGFNFQGQKSGFGLVWFGFLTGPCLRLGYRFAIGWGAELATREVDE